MKLHLSINDQKATILGRMTGDGGLTGDYVESFPKGEKAYDKLKARGPGEMTMEEFKEIISS
jgi:hypothetical protein